MKLRRLRLLTVFGLLALPLLGFLLPQHTEASSPLQVGVVNKPTVTGGNTPNVNVVNTPNVNVSNTPYVNVANQVGIASLPDIQIAGGSMSVSSVVSPVNVFSYADLYPIEAGGKCLSNGGTQCTQDNFYTVPNGFNAVISDFTGLCGTGNIISAQLVAQWGGMTQNYTAPLTPINAAVYANGGSFILTVAYDWTVTGAKFYAAAGTPVTPNVASNPGDQGYGCSYTISGYLVPTSAFSPNLGVRGTPRTK